MSMLAEQRRKQKYSTDPRGTNWSRDETKIGQKLMEKMGWSKGKGLGANENGKTEHVGVVFKGDNLGVGCSKKHADNWIAHQDDFDSLLSSLNQDYKTPNDSGTEDNVKVQSLEEKSKVAKGRVHYKKFAKGKDLSRCQGDDMACIMGKRKSKSGTSTPKSEATSGANSESEQDYGVQTFNSNTSVKDYFAKKMAEIKRLRAGNQGSPVQVSCKKEDSEEANSAGESSCTNSDTQDVNENKDSKKAKKKAKKPKLEKEPPVQTSDVEDDGNSSESSVKKAKKKSKKRKLSDTENTDLDSEEPSKPKKKSKKDKKLEVETVSEEEPRKKKKKSKKQKKNEIDNEKSSGDEVESHNDSIVKGILKKTKPKVDLGFSGANVLDISGYGKKSDKAPTEDSLVSAKKSKKKKKKSKK